MTSLIRFEKYKDTDGFGSRSAAVQLGRYASIPPLSRYLRARVTIRDPRARFDAPIKIHIEGGRNRLFTLDFRLNIPRFIE